MTEPRREWRETLVWPEHDFALLSEDYPSLGEECRQCGIPYSAWIMAPRCERLARPDERSPWPPPTGPGFPTPEVVRGEGDDLVWVPSLGAATQNTEAEHPSIIEQGRKEAPTQ